MNKQRTLIEKIIYLLQNKLFMKKNYNVISNGTENHIVIVDLRSKNITGKDLEKVLGSVNITVNKNSVPNDTASPLSPQE